jgi:hypothetical protein
MKVHLLFCLSIAASLAGCGPKKEDIVLKNKAGTSEVKITVTGDDGVTTVVGKDMTTRVGSGENAKIPTNIDPYPGSKLTSSMTGRSDKNMASAISFSTKDTPQQVAGFYKETLIKKGYSIAAEATSNDNVMLTFERKADGGAAFIMITGDKNGSSAVITTGGK